MNFDPRNWDALGPEYQRRLEKNPTHISAVAPEGELRATRRPQNGHQVLRLPWKHE